MASLIAVVAALFFDATSVVGLFAIAILVSPYFAWRITGRWPLRMRVALTASMLAAPILGPVALLMGRYVRARRARGQRSDEIEYLP